MLWNRKMSQTYYLIFHGSVTASLDFALGTAVRPLLRVSSPIKAKVLTVDLFCPVFIHCVAGTNHYTNFVRVLSDSKGSYNK